VIRFDAVTKRYPDGTMAVAGLSLDMPTGATTVLVGPSGSGKTTALRMINRMIDPTSGRVWVDGRDTASIRPVELRRGIGYVIQQAGLFPHKTVVDNIATVPLLLGERRRSARKRAEALLERVGLHPELAERFPAQLSGGQQQRVGVARALAGDPPILLMDEPFSAVDPVVREQLQTEFLQLQRGLAKTIVFVTHDIDEAIKLGDHVAVLRAGGTLAQVATPANLLSRPADGFVAGFIGRDRGYRALGFAAAGSLPLMKERPVRLGNPLRTALECARDGWVLVVDAENRPQGWVAPVARAGKGLDREVTGELLNLGGTLATEGGTFREALDAALSSPSGRGVVVHRDGSLAGTVTASDVLAKIEARAARSRADALQPPHRNGDGTSTVAGEGPLRR
jgi:osmoprotectant transport system ATP-binding protein